MEYGQFIEHVNRLKVLNPIWFELDADPMGTAADFQVTENQLKIDLPEEYKKFIEVFGGGYFAFTIIYSVSPDSEWNIVKQNRSLDLLEKHNFLAVSDNQSGDYYGYKIQNELIRNGVYMYEHENHQITRTKFRNIYEYIMEVGLKQTT